MKQKMFITVTLAITTVSIVSAVILVVPIIKNSDGILSKESQEILSETVAIQKKQESALHPMAIEALRAKSYPAGNFAVEQTLSIQSNYRQLIVSYQSENNKIYGLLTIPTTLKPEQGFPAVVFVHGYIPPKEYSTTGNYAGYQATLAKAGFVTFKPDLRGHGKSEGESVSAHFSEKYVVDVMSAISYLKKYELVDPNRIGYWGHSNGGEIGLRIAVISPDIKAFSLWAGVVGSYQDMLETYNQKIPFLKNSDDILIRENGLPSTNKEFWDKLDPYVFLDDIAVPIQLHHGTKDSSVPIELSIRLADELEKKNKNVEFIEYPNDNHNIGNNANTAWRKTIDFFRTNL